LARAIAQHAPDKYETWFYFCSKGYRHEETGFLKQIKSELSEEQQKQFAGHMSSPFCWLETPDGKRDAKGGRDRLCEWALATFPEIPAIKELASTDPSITEIWVDETPGTHVLPEEALDAGLAQEEDVKAPSAPEMPQEAAQVEAKAETAKSEEATKEAKPEDAKDEDAKPEEAKVEDSKTEEAAQEETPATQEEPAKEEEAPAKEDEAPAKEDEAPGKEEEAPAKEEAPAAAAPASE
jgi:hypothetical protein